ncbi:hypothetical protein P8609_08745 [Lysobacter sp. UC]|uniref:Uncharacterized protein n=1 Tax=Lysobacter arvi TaxID=3038776 RepID=A0ABU1CCZ9_9GAMM|nr:hypothetical protein [Lysobacter arvi]
MGIERAAQAACLFSGLDDRCLGAEVRFAFPGSTGAALAPLLLSFLLLLLLLLLAVAAEPPIRC